jgi:hypothetical protein
LASPPALVPAPAPSKSKLKAPAPSPLASSPPAPPTGAPAPSLGASSPGPVGTDLVSPLIPFYVLIFFLKYSSVNLFYRLDLTNMNTHLLKRKKKENRPVILIYL